MTSILPRALALAAVVAAGHASAAITLFGHDNFHGPRVTLTQPAPDFREFNFNDRASSVIVEGEPWEVCEHADFGGRCMILRPGRYPDLRATGLNDRISSVRRIQHDARVEDDRYAPPPPPVYDWRRRPQEFVESVPIESVHVVYAAPQQQQQCWVEQSAAPANARTGGALVGGLIGGILGHQIGDGNRQGATVGGAVVGAVVGSQIARGAEQPQAVTRCNSVPVNQGPDHYDVSYWYHGVRHHVQTTQPPGPTIVVNGDGEPRI